MECFPSEGRTVNIFIVMRSELHHLTLLPASPWRDLTTLTTNQTDLRDELCLEMYFSSENSLWCFITCQEITSENIRFIYPSERTLQILFLFRNFLHRNDKKWIFERLGVDTISWRLVVWNTSLYRQMEYCQNYFCLWVLVKNILRLSERNIITHCDYLCVKVQWVQSCPAVRTFLILTIFKQ